MTIDAQHISQAALSLVEDVEKTFGPDAVLRNVALVASVEVDGKPEVLWRITSGSEDAGLHRDMTGPLLEAARQIKGHGL